MLYFAYQASSDVMAPVRAWANMALAAAGARIVGDSPAIFAIGWPTRLIPVMRGPIPRVADSAATGSWFGNRDFDVARGRLRPMSSFGTLLNFKKDIGEAYSARARIAVAPLPV